MIAFDTNLLVRFIVEDDPAQTQSVVRAITKVIEAGHRIYVSQIVLSELVWVLSYTYGLARDACAGPIQRRSRRFADSLIAEIATAAGCDRILTFDVRLWSDPRFVAPARWRSNR